jgi:hydrogenase maturation factor
MTGGSMIAKVAQAIAVAQGDTNWHVHVHAARAAVTAMRDPTTAMLQAALPDMPDWGYLPEEWQVMIDYVAAEHPI